MNKIPLQCETLCVASRLGTMFESNKFLFFCLNKKILCGTHFPNTDYISLEFTLILKVEIHISLLLLFFILSYHIYSVVSPRQTLSAIV